MENNHADRTDAGIRNRRRKFFLGIGISIVIILIVTLSIMINYLSQLKYEIARRDSLIQRMQAGDSLYQKGLKNYADVIQKYVQDCKFSINGKEISSQELVRIVNDANNEKIALLDSLIHCNERISKNYDAYIALEQKIKENSDSLAFKTIFLNLAKKRYGLQYNRSYSKETYSFSISSPKLDSALILYGYYKDRLKKDSVGSWVIIDKQMIIRERLAPELNKKQKKKP